MADNVDSSHEGNGTPGNGIVFPAVEKLLSAVDALIDLDVGGSGPSSRALALVSRRQNELIRASGKCDAKVAALRRQLAQRDARISRVTASWERLLVKVRRYREEIVDARSRIAELEAKLAAAADLARDSAEQAGELVPGHGRPRRCDVSEPKFGDHVEGVYASAGNPQKFGTFVEVIRRAGRMNPGTFYRLTNEHGDFWEYPAGSCAILDRRSPSAADRAVERIKALVTDRPPFPINDREEGWFDLARDIEDIIREETAHD